MEPIPCYLSANRVQASSALRKYFQANSTDVTIVFGESCCGQKKNGPQTAPPLVCSAEVLRLIAELGWTPSVVRVPQVFKPSPAGHCYEPLCVVSTCQAVGQAVGEALAKDSFPLLIGGDHCLAMGSIAASKRRHPNLCVLWFDAHADINTAETSPSGNLHGMPIAALLGLDGMKKAPGFAEGEFSCIVPSDLGYIGLRDVDTGEYETIAALGIKTAHHMPDVIRMGIRAQLEFVLDQINPDRTRPIHLSFDVDGMDPIDAPSTGTTAPNGVRIHEAIEMVRAVRETGLLVSMDLVEVNPSLGDERDVEITIQNARWILAQGLGRRQASA